MENFKEVTKQEINKEKRMRWEKEIEEKYNRIYGKPQSKLDELKEDIKETFSWLFHGQSYDSYLYIKNKKD